MAFSKKNIIHSRLGGLLICFALLTMLNSCSMVVRSRTPDVERRDEPSSVSEFKELGIPPGHLPPPGSCRIWIPGRPPGHQSPPGNCSDLRQRVPIGAWLVYRYVGDPDHVEVFVYHEKRPSVVVVVRHYQAATGRFLSESQP